MELIAVVSDVVQAPEAKSLARGEGAVGRDDLIGEAYATLGGDAFGSKGRDGGTGHQRSLITHDALLPRMPTVMDSIP